MPTYLLTWNPLKWRREKMQPWIEKGFYLDTWSSGNRKDIHPDDRVFLIKLGREEPRGIMASGWVKSECFKDDHWDRDRRARGEKALFNEVHLDTLLDPDKRIFPRLALNKGVYSKMHWDSQSSGVIIPDDVAEKLEKDWAAFLKLPAPAVTDPVLKRASSWKGGGGGESQAHKALKEYVAKHPGIVGLAPTGLQTDIEFDLPSGDVVDVFFHTKKLWIAAEVKAANVPDEDIVRGLFQCVKYRAVAAAAVAVQGGTQEVDAVLVLERTLPPGLLKMRKTLGVRVIEGVTPQE